MKTWNSVFERDSIYFIYNLISLGGIQCVEWTGHGVTNHRFPGISEQRCRRSREEEGGGVVSPATSKNWPQICFWCYCFFQLPQKNTSLWRSFGEEGLERPQIRQLSRMLIARPLRIMKTVLVPGSNSNRIFSFTDDVVSTGK